MEFRRNALQLHLFRQHSSSNDNPNYIIQVGNVARIYHFYYTYGHMIACVLGNMFSSYLFAYSHII